MNAQTNQGALAIRESSGGALALSESELVDVLQSSLYPGAALKSIKMVIGYCKAADLDPMQKPVHIVPMYDRASQGMRDVIMPGVGLYRTQASRSGALAGISDPEFGPMRQESIGGQQIEYPDWCRVVVKRQMPSGVIAEFAAIEYWIENYAVKGGKEKSIAPNAMWTKRPRGQIAKCAQAQALRTAFPEMTGSAPTADEMEGKQFDQAEIDNTPKPDTEPKKAEICSDEKFSANKEAWEKIITSGRKTVSELIVFLESKAPLSVAQKKEISDWKKTEVKIAVSEESNTEKTSIVTQSMDDFNAGLDGDSYVPE